MEIVVSLVLVYLILGFINAYFGNKYVVRAVPKERRNGKELQWTLYCVFSWPKFLYSFIKVCNYSEETKRQIRDVLEKHAGDPEKAQAEIRKIRNEA